MFCQNCGASLADGAKFCPECGSQQEPAAPSASVQNLCPFCGEALDSDSVFCEKCGRQLLGQAPIAANATRYGGQSAPPPISIPQAPAQEKATSGSKTTLVLAIVIVALAAVIGLLLWRQLGDRPQDNGNTVIAEAEIPRDTEPPTVEVTPEPVAEIVPEPTNEPTPEAAPESTPEPAPESTPELSAVHEPEPEPELTAGHMRYDPLDFEVFVTPTMEDFLWADYDILHGVLPSGIDRLESFEEVEGGWKLYIIDDPDGEYGSDMERFCRCAFGEDANGKGIGIRWDYVFDSFEGTGNEEDTPDSFYYGTFENGVLNATGPGRVVITDFWYANGHEYAVGTMTWPDGIPAAMLLVRP